MRFVILLGSLLMVGNALAQEPRVRVVSQAEFSSEQDSCLDHAVKELGMSAKRIEGRRAWKVGPQFLHPSVVANGELGIEASAEAGATKVSVTASFPVKARSSVDEVEIESRMKAIAEKLAQLCGAKKEQTSCQVVAPGATARTCRSS